MTSTNVTRDVDAEAVLQFWFGALDAAGRSSAEASARWFRKDAAFDAQIRERFLPLHSALAAGEHLNWLASARSNLAYVIVLDQFSRNLFRSSAQAFATDARALDAAHAGLAAGFDRALPADMRVFFYMPLMHSETLADQDRCVALFAALDADLTAAGHAGIPHNVHFAKLHRDVIARFGRFPHRNVWLDRTSTPDELVYLAEPGSGF
jgi:uncharacterized protein (DUF924 family)